MRRGIGPPVLPQRMVERTIPGGASRDGLLGDLHELYLERRHRRGRWNADVWYWREACSAVLRYGFARTRKERAGGDPRRARGPEVLWIRFLAELRPALRRLHRTPGFTLAAVLPLAIGLGATATIFTLARDVVLGPLPYPESDRLVVVRHQLPGFQGGGEMPEVGAFLGQLLHYRERSRLVTDIGGWWTFDGTFEGADGAEYLHLGGMTAGLLSALRVRPGEGRLIEPDDPWPQRDGAGVTLLSQAFRRQRFGDAASAVGRRITTQGWSYEVVGVLPPDLPLAPSRPVLWHAIPDGQARENPQWTVPALVARLAPGATREGLERELAALTAELPGRYPDGTNIRNAVERGRMTPRVMPLREWIVGDVSRAIWLLFASVALLLVVALANVSGLFLVRADAARRDHAVRRALGSGSGGIVLHALLESAIVVGVAAGVGLFLASTGVGAITRWLGDGIPRADAIAVGGEEIGFLVVLGLAAIVAVTAVQLLHQRGDSGGPGLLAGGRSAAAGPARLRLRHAFVALQIAVALVLMVNGGLILRSARTLGRVDTGFEASGLLTFRIVFPFREIAAGTAPGIATRFYRDVADAIEAIPGVDAAGWGTCVPLSPLCGVGGFPIRPPEGGESRDDPVAGYVQVSPAYRAAMGMPLVAGRDLRPGDELDAGQPVLISEGLARELWPGRSVLGRTFTASAFGNEAVPPTFTVVGVVGDVRFEDLRRREEPIVYVPPRSDAGMVSFAVRTSLPPVALLEPIRRAVRDLRADVPVAYAETMQSSIARETASIRFSSLLLILAAATTLLLSVLGVYGMIAYAVGLRRPEFGVRLALGATGGQLRRMVLAQGLVTAALGVAVGLVAAAAASRFLRSLLFGIEAVDAPTYAIAAMLLLLAAAAATGVPAVRASRVDPREALRGS